MTVERRSSFLTSDSEGMEGEGRMGRGVEGREGMVEEGGKWRDGRSPSGHSSLFTTHCSLHTPHTPLISSLLLRKLRRGEGRRGEGRVRRERGGMRGHPPLTPHFLPHSSILTPTMRRGMECRGGEGTGGEEMGGEGRERRGRLDKGVEGRGGDEVEVTLLSLLTPQPSLLTPHSILLIPHSSLLIPHSSHLIRRSSLHSSERRGVGREGRVEGTSPSLLTPHSDGREWKRSGGEWGEGREGRSPSRNSSHLTPHSSLLASRSSLLTPHSSEGREGEGKGGD